MEEQSSRKRVRDDLAELEFDSAEVKRLREDLLCSLDDSDPAHEAREDLVSVMKSFEEEISAPPSPAPATSASVVIDLTSESAESRPELGYLLEASDDELGLPPAKGGTELVRVDSVEFVGADEFWSLEGEFPNYDAFELGMYGPGEFGGHVAQFDSSLFDYSYVADDGSERSDFSWRLGTLPFDQAD